MDVVLGILQLVFVGYIAFCEFNRKSPSVFLWATLFVMFSITHTYSAIVGDKDYQPELISNVSAFVIIFCIAYLLIRTVLPFKIKKERLDSIMNKPRIEGKYSESMLMNACFWVILMVIALKLGMIIIGAGFIPGLSWAKVREYRVSLDYVNVMQPLNLLFYLLSGVMLLFIFDKKWFRLIVCALAFLLSMLVTRSRIEALPLAIVFLSVFVMKTKKLTLLKVFSAVLISFVSVYCIYALRAFRHFGTIESFFKNYTFGGITKRVIDHLATGSGELGLRRYFYYFMQNNNEFENFGRGHTYIRMLMVFVPTQWSFGIKPPDFALSMGSAINMLPGGSMHPTLFGDAYANFGWLGIMVGGIFALYANVLDTIIIKQRHRFDSVIIYILAGVTYVIIGRGAVYNGFLFLAYGLLFMAMAYVVKKFIRRWLSARM